MSLTLGKHQLDAIKKMKNGCVLKGGVGSGKSRTAIAYYTSKVCGGTIPLDGVTELKPFIYPVPLYIITTAKKRDSKEWEEECAAFGYSTKTDISFGNTRIVIDSWNNITKYKEVKDAFFVFDEQRLVGKGAWVKAFLRISKTNAWILLSATPGDNWMDYGPVFIANGFYANITDFQRRHVVYSNYSQFPKIERFIETGVLEKHRRDIVVEMPLERHTKRHHKNMFVSYDQEKFKKVFKDRWNIEEERPVREVSEMFALLRRIVNSDPSRLAAVMEIMEKHERLIIFYNYSVELEMLRTLGTTFDIKVAEWNGRKHDPLPGGDRWLYLVQYTAGSEGWNCITTDATVFYSLNYSYRITEQAQGRIDRINTKYVDLYYYFLRSSSLIDQAIWQSLRSKKTFNEAAFAKSISI